MIKKWLYDVFLELDRRVEERWTAGNLSNGFWRSGVIPKLTPVDTMREYGFWQGKGDLGRGLHGQVSVSLIGGHTRIGIFLPNRMLEGMTTWGESMASAVSGAHDGRQADIVRQIGGDTLFDRIFTDAPFSADWFRDCAVDEDSLADGSREILANHLSWRVIDIWESAMRTLLSSDEQNDPPAGQEITVYSCKPISPMVTESLPVTIRDSWEVAKDTWMTVLFSESLPTVDLENALKEMLPDHGITTDMNAVKARKFS